MKSLAVAFAALTLATLGFVSVAAADTSQASATFATIKPSLAFVISKVDKKTTAFGTAFCIASYGDASFFLTNRHVVGNDDNPRLFLMADPGKSYQGTVLRRGTNLDVAIIVVAASNVPTVSLSNATPAVGQSIAIAGFPAIQIDLYLDKLGLSPSLHLGTLSALLGNGALLEYDAQTDHGNSGGPLFDADHGLVFGMVTWGTTGDTGAVQDNIAIPMLALAQFFTNAGVQPTYAGIEAAASTASPTPAAVVIDTSGCRDSYSQFQSAYEAWRGSFDRYVTASRTTTSMVPTSTANNSFAFIGIEVYVGLEIRAINSTINAEEPKLTAAQSSMIAQSNTSLARVTGQLFNDIQTMDQYSLLWSQSRSRLIYSVAGGGYATPVDQSAIERVRDAQTEVSGILAQLAVEDPCHS